MDPLDFAVAMENGIIANLDRLKLNCSPVLAPVMEALIRAEQGIVTLVEQARPVRDGESVPDTELPAILSREEEWGQLQIRFDPAAAPAVLDYTVLWSVRAMLDKSAQYYRQAAKETEPARLRLLLASVAEIKTMLRRRIDGLERIMANQAWKAVGFAPGLLAKE